MLNPTIIPAETIAFYYRVSLDSVTLVNQLATQETRKTDETDTLRRNVEHLELMVSKDWWTDEDLSPFTNAIALGNSVLA
jgi:hypothetical protein